MSLHLNSVTITVNIQEWAYKWKISFNPGRTKAAQEVLFSRNIIYPNLNFNNLPIVKTASQKQLELDLDVRLTFNNHKNEKPGKAIKVVGYIMVSSWTLLKVFCFIFLCIFNELNELFH